jgi:Ca2+-binding RTX toxin-like protein
MKKVLVTIALLFAACGGESRPEWMLKGFAEVETETKRHALVTNPFGDVAVAVWVGNVTYSDTGTKTWAIYRNSSLECYGVVVDHDGYIDSVASVAGSSYDDYIVSVDDSPSGATSIYCSDNGGYNISINPWAHSYSGGTRMTIYGGSGDDQMVCGGHVCWAYGENGHDTIWAHSNYQNIYGGAGNDKIFSATSGGGSQTGLYGQDGDDCIDPYTIWAGVTGGNGTDSTTRSSTGGVAPESTEYFNVSTCQ